MKKSLKSQLVVILSVSLIFSAVITFSILYGYQRSQYHAEVKTLKGELLNGLSHQLNLLLTAQLIPEQQQGIPLLLNSIEKEEDLTSIHFAPGGGLAKVYPDCEISDRATLCFRENGKKFAVLAPVKEGNHIFGYLIKEKSLPLSSNSKLLSVVNITCVFLFLVFTVLFMLLARVTSVDVLRYLDSLVSWLDNSLKNGGSTNTLPKSKFKELNMLAQKVNEAVVQHQTAVNENRVLREWEVVAKISSQVAHDIRSPLAALEVGSESLGFLPESQRVLLRTAITRINDIANNLLSVQEKKRDARRIVNASSLKCELISSVLESIVSEKRVEYQNRANISIDIECSSSSYGLFATVERNELKRVISNLINNSVESIHGKGEVIVRLTPAENRIMIQVADTGKGIPNQLIPWLLKDGGSIGKDGHHGLGLGHAKESVSSWGGELSIYSKEGIGTTVLIELPRATPPSWFLAQLDITDGMTVIIIDDQESIHGILKNRFSNFNVHLVHHYTSNDLKEWLMRSKESNVLFLVDYELIGDKSNGIEIINQNSIAANSILVTSRYDEEKIVEDCTGLGIQLLPKDLATAVPIRVRKWNPPEHVQMIL